LDAAGDGRAEPYVTNPRNMNTIEFRDYHERLAARLRSLAATATPPAMKARLLEEAAEHERHAGLYRVEPQKLKPAASE